MNEMEERNSELYGWFPFAPKKKKTISLLIAMYL